MSVIAFVPARCGSKSIPFKNIKDFCGKPLIYWNLKSLQECSLVDEIFLATDCDKISEVATSFNFSKVKVYRRDKDNAEDQSSTESVMLEFLEKRSFEQDDIFVLVQATSPLTQASQFLEALEMFFQGGYDSVLTCVRAKKFFWNEDGTPMNYDFMNRPRRQDFKGVFMENGAFYINRIRHILKAGNRLFGKIGVYEMPEYMVVDIDEEDDWAIAEKMMQKYILKSNI